jgi:hypothetical protein
MKKIISLVLISASLVAFEAAAATRSLNISWSGASFGNTASATGHITFDDSQLPNVGFQNWNGLPGSGVTDFGVTITGASSGNGTFTLADFSALYFATPSLLDLSTQLIGQSLTNGFTFGDSGAGSSGGDFNIFGNNGVAPTGTWYFRLTTNGGSGDNMLVTSMTPSAVPVPAAVWLFGSAMTGLLGFGKRKQTKMIAV